MVVDDQALVRAGFAAILSTEDDLEVVAEVEDGAEALATAQSVQPDVVLMDIRMPRRRRHHRHQTAAQPRASRGEGADADDLRPRRIPL